MGFFSDLGKKTTETAGKISKETKLKLKINENKGKIEDIYEEIGKKVYEKHIRENDLCIKDDLENECAQIDSLSKEIEDARLEILKLNNKRLCCKCSAEIEASAQFCPKCGEKQVTEEPTIQEEALEKLENSEVAPEKIQEAEAVKEDLKEEIAEQNNAIIPQPEQNTAVIAQPEQNNAVIAQPEQNNAVIPQPEQNTAEPQPSVETNSEETKTDNQ